MTNDHPPKPEPEWRHKDEIKKCTTDGCDLSEDEITDKLKDIAKAKEEAEAADSSDDDSPSGLDMKEVQRRMTSLKRQFNKTTKVVEKKGRHSKEANAEFSKLGAIFQFLKFSPRMFDDIAAIARHGLNILREKERFIQTKLVKEARMPRKDFLKAYADNLTKVRWIDGLMKEKKYKNRFDKK
mgnify:CR=1 FL=1